jgi:UDP-N-acetylmuramyl pentapeptide phosphotransferase/UDP-N-acetylglucosamine-1-phosphate transferase
MTSLYLFIICLLFGGAGGWLILRCGKFLGLLDKSNNRSSHKGVVPKGGGIGILAAFVFASLFLEKHFAFWLPTSIIALVSLLGDRIEISPKIRLLLQFMAALILIIFSPFSRELSAFWFFFYAVFIVATANWYNFMDGINGIAGITGIVGFGLLALFGFINNVDGFFTMLSICLALSCIGFLPFNLPKARVFMGDVGSILLGFVFAAIVIIASKTFLDFICLAGCLFPFYADELVTMAVRLKDGENLLNPHRRHLYQVLANEMGIAHWEVSLGYGVFQFFVGLSLFSASLLGIFLVIIILVIIFGGFVWVNYYVRERIANLK